MSANVSGNHQISGKRVENNHKNFKTLQSLQRMYTNIIHNTLTETHRTPRLISLYIFYLSISKYIYMFLFCGSNINFLFRQRNAYLCLLNKCMLYRIVLLFVNTLKHNTHTPNNNKTTYVNVNEDGYFDLIFVCFVSLFR